ncbi:hypothetical protein SAMN02927921_00560 [Sinomicrobium oceani]|uniref:Uncharacterized protein n=1 Tax=Sinomicrobium oceani TaxID=1150368 RepID=A0A1K1MCF6_9FLAO|nr:hypothetical protein [Sinomicrobium oceani]SFW20797.1 hypothetical protein SAMN02927921_00560 [Sinomicrobium oceani]
MRYIIYCLLTVVAVIGGLFVISKRDTPENYDFSRTFTDSPLVVKNRKILKLRNEFHYIAGLTEKNIFLGDQGYSGKLFTTGYNLNDGLYKDLNVPDSIRIAWKAVKIFVNYPDVFLIEGISPTILQGTFPGPGPYNIYHPEKPFHHPIPIPKNIIIARTHDIEKKSYMLAKIILDSLPILETKYILEQQNGIIFSSDGMLSYDPVTEKTLYVNFYNNRFTCLDTSLNLIYQGNTIAPIGHAQLKMDTIHSENKMVLSAPALFVNKQNSVYNGRLYIRSVIMAKNEDKRAFKRHAVIDVYELANTNSKYLYSFYLPAYENKKLREFKVFNNHIISLQGEYLVIDQFKLKS